MYQFPRIPEINYFRVYLTLRSCKFYNGSDVFLCYVLLLLLLLGCAREVVSVGSIHGFNAAVKQRYFLRTKSIRLLVDVAYFARHFQVSA